MNGTDSKGVLRLEVDPDAVTGTIESETISVPVNVSRAEGELVVVYVHTGELAFGDHSLGQGDAAILSGAEHYDVATKPLDREAGIALVRLASLTGTGLVWIP
ncbi:hypothetical protein [Arthrobacter sp. C152]